MPTTIWPDRLNEEHVETLTMDTIVQWPQIGGSKLVLNPNKCEFWADCDKLLAALPNIYVTFLQLDYQFVGWRRHVTPASSNS